MTPRAPATAELSRAQAVAAASAEHRAVYGRKMHSPWRANQDRTVLGYEIDHLRLYGWPVRDIAAHLACSPDVVTKWIRTHPEPTDPWEVPADATR